MKISIITVCFNAGDSLEDTLRSIISQTYSNKEIIIIDGGSTDKSIDIIKSYADSLAYYRSEPDKGIYDAMNKGAKQATGDYIIYMNAGDTFVNPNVLCEVSSRILKDSDIVYGDNIMVYKTKSIYHKAHFFSKYDINLPFNHQSTFTKTEVLKLNPFEIHYKIAGDYHFFYNMFISGKSFQYIPIPIANYSMDGVSQQNIIKTFREVCQIQNRAANFRYYIQLSILKIKLSLSRFLPQQLLNFYRRVVNQ